MNTDNSRWASSIPPVDVTWLDPLRIPRPGPSFIVGFGGVGKSTLACTKAAQWSKQGETVLLSLQEDIPEAATVIPRLIAAGAELDKIIMPPEGRAWDFSDHDDVLHFATYASMNKVTVAIFDPLDTHVPDVSNSHGRMQIADLMRAAKALDITIVFCHHFNKGSKDIRTGVGGARGVYNSARSILIVGLMKDVILAGDTLSPVDHAIPINDDPEQDVDADREGSFLFEAQHKNSYAPEQPTLCYERSSVEIPRTNTSVPKMTLIGESKFTADNVFALQASTRAGATTRIGGNSPSDKGPNQQQQARILIGNFLDMKSPMPGTELQDRVMACGITQHTFELARKSMVDDGLIQKGRKIDPNTQRAFWYWELSGLNIPDSI